MNQYLDIWEFIAGKIWLCIKKSGNAEERKAGFQNFNGIFSRFCLKECVGPGCKDKPRYAIEYKTVSLPFGIGANQDLLRLAVYDSSDQLHLNTRYGLIAAS